MTCDGSPSLLGRWDSCDPSSISRSSSRSLPESFRRSPASVSSPSASALAPPRRRSPVPTCRPGSAASFQNGNAASLRRARSPFSSDSARYSLFLSRYSFALANKTGASLFTRLPSSAGSLPACSSCALCADSRDLERFPPAAPRARAHSPHQCAVLFAPTSSPRLARGLRRTFRCTRSWF